jgi:hypothetical protein
MNISVRHIDDESLLTVKKKKKKYNEIQFTTAAV